VVQFLVVVLQVVVVFLNKDAIIENVKSKVMESVLPSGLGSGGLGLPSPSTPTPEAPASPIPLGF